MACRHDFMTCSWRLVIVLASATFVGCDSRPSHEQVSSVWNSSRFADNGIVWFEVNARDGQVISIYQDRNGCGVVDEKIDVGAGKLVRVLKDTDRDGQFDIVFSSIGGAEAIDLPCPKASELDRKVDLAPYRP